MTDSRFLASSLFAMSLFAVPGAEQALVFDGIPVRAAGRHLLLASAFAGDATESMLGLNVEGVCNA